MMKKICCLIFSLFLLFSLFSCSGAHRGYDYAGIAKRAFSARLFGEWYGVRTEARIEMREAQGDTRDFYIHFLSGSLSGVIVRREGDSVRISTGGVEERDFYAGGLCDIAKLFCPDDCAPVRVDKSNGTGVLSAKADGLEFYVTVREDGVPQSIECEGLFSFEVKEFGLIK